MKGEKAKRIAAEMLNTARKKIWINPEEAEALKEAITKEDVRALIKEGIIKKSKRAEKSSVRSRTLKGKKQKGRKRGHGKRKASLKKRGERKKAWIKRVRAQRRTLRELKEKEGKALEKVGYRKLYRMVKGDYFRGKRYLEMFVKGEGAKK